MDSAIPADITKCHQTPGQILSSGRQNTTDIAQNLRPSAQMFLLYVLNDNTTHFAGVIVFNLQHAHEKFLIEILTSKLSHFAHAGYGSILINRRLIYNVKCVTIRTPGIIHL